MVREIFNRITHGGKKVPSKDDYIKESKKILRELIQRHKPIHKSPNKGSRKGIVEDEATASDAYINMFLNKIGGEPKGVKGSGGSGTLSGTLSGWSNKDMSALRDVINNHYNIDTKKPTPGGSGKPKFGEGGTGIDKRPTIEPEHPDLVKKPLVPFIPISTDPLTDLSEWVFDHRINQITSGLETIWNQWFGDKSMTWNDKTGTVETKPPKLPPIDPNTFVIVGNDDYGKLRPGIAKIPPGINASINNMPFNPSTGIINTTPEVIKPENSHRPRLPIQPGGGGFDEKQGFPNVSDGFSDISNYSFIQQHILDLMKQHIPQQSIIDFVKQNTKIDDRSIEAFLNHVLGKDTDTGIKIEPVPPGESKEKDPSGDPKPAPPGETGKPDTKPRPKDPIVTDEEDEKEQPQQGDKVGVSKFTPTQVDLSQIHAGILRPQFINPKNPKIPQWENIDTKFININDLEKNPNWNSSINLHFDKERWRWLNRPARYPFPNRMNCGERPEYSDHDLRMARYGSDFFGLKHTSQTLVGNMYS